MIRLYREMAKVFAILFIAAIAVLGWKLLDSSSVSASFEAIGLLALVFGAGATMLLFMAAVVSIMDDTRQHLAALSRTVIQSFEDAKAEAESGKAR